MYDVVHGGDKGCMRAPKAWGNPSRVSIPEAILTDPPLLVYYDVLVARDDVCKRLTRATHAKKGKGVTGAAAVPPVAAADGRQDSDRIVWTTHMNKGRMQRLMDLSKRWGGCISVALWVCAQEDWEYVSKLHAENADIGAHVTFHAVLGHGAYPYNLQRNVALAPFAPWAVGNGRPAPWVVVADADGVPSVGEAVMARVVVDAAAGKGTEPPLITGSVPEELKWMGTGPLGLAAPDIDATPFAYPARNAEVCDAWDGLPEPMQCRVTGHPSGLGWGRAWQTAAWATERSRCGRPVDPMHNFFVLPSFDTRRDNGEAIARLRDISPSSPPSHAWAYLRKLWDAGVVELQAQESYAPSYESMVPWRAWRDMHPAGLLAVHYGFIYEPYIVAKTPFPSTSLDKWEPFDEYFREPGYDKCIFFTETAGLRWDDPGKYYLQVLPQLFLLNDDAGTSSGPRPSRHMNWERCVDVPAPICAAARARTRTTPLTRRPHATHTHQCTCAGSWQRQGSMAPGARTCAPASPMRTCPLHPPRASGITDTCGD